MATHKKTLKLPGPSPPPPVSPPLSRTSQPAAVGPARLRCAACDWDLCSVCSHKPSAAAPSPPASVGLAAGSVVVVVHSSEAQKAWAPVGTRGIVAAAHADGSLDVQYFKEDGSDMYVRAMCSVPAACLKAI